MEEAIWTGLNGVRPFDIIHGDKENYEKFEVSSRALSNVLLSYYDQKDPANECITP